MGKVTTAYFAWVVVITTCSTIALDLYYSYCERARLRPEREASGLLRNLPNPQGTRRPADVLVCSGSAFAPTLPDGSRGRTPAKIAFDFAIINALGRGHWQETFNTIGSAAEAYGEWKKSFQNTAAACEEAGILFQPIVLDMQGGVTKEARASIHTIAQCVAAAESADAKRIKTEMLERLALTISRSSAEAIKRRRQRKETASAGTAKMQILRSLHLQLE